MPPMFFSDINGIMVPWRSLPYYQHEVVATACNLVVNGLYVSYMS